MKLFSRQAVFVFLAYGVFPLLTLWSCFNAMYLYNPLDREFQKYLMLWVPSIFLYYAYITQLIIGQRLPFLDQIWGFPNLLRFHSQLSMRIMAVALVLHVGFQFLDKGWYIQTDWGVLAGVFAVFGTGLLVWIARRFWVTQSRQRQRDYRKMRLLHNFFYLLAVLVWYHVVKADVFAEDNWFGVTLVTGYLLVPLCAKLVMLIGSASAPLYQVVQVKALNPDLTFLALEPEDTGNTTRVRALSTHEPGQYAYFSFFIGNDGGSAKAGWEEHPFSFSSRASAGTEDPSRLTLIARRAGNFTDTLPALPVGSPVRINGPFGRFCFRGDAFDKHYFIAGGVGIVPFLSILDHLAGEAARSHLQENRNSLSLCWFVRTEEDAVFEERFARYRQALPNLTIQTYIGRKPNDPEILDRLIDRSESPRRQGIYYCGTQTAQRVIHAVMKKKGIPLRNFHTELFSL